MNTTLITGADGHLGKAIAGQLLADSEQDLLLLVRAANDAELQKKKDRLGHLAHATRCRVMRADLRDAQPFAEVDATAVTGIVHAAAVTSFAVDRQSAETVNVGGTGKILAFADRCPNLQNFAYLSSLYSTGLQPGVIEEGPVQAEPTFANHYEWSKWQAERLITMHDGLPWQICRVATLLAEDIGGAVVQQNAIHNTLRLLYYGLLSVVPGAPDTRVYMTTTDYAVAAICALIATGETQRVFHISDSGDDAATLGQVIDTVYDTFSEDPHFARLRILKPLFCDLESFNTLASGAEQLGGALAQSLSSVAPFAPQLFNDKNVQVAGTIGALNGLCTPDTGPLLQNACKHLARTRWGLLADPREERT